MDPQFVLVSASPPRELRRRPPDDQFPFGIEILQPEIKKGNGSSLIGPTHSEIPELGERRHLPILGLGHSLD